MSDHEYAAGDRVESDRFILWTGTFVGPVFHPDPVLERIGPWCLVRWDQSYGDALVRIENIRPVGE